MSETGVSSLATADFLTGGAIPGLAQPAYRLWRFASPSLPVLIAAPHAGRAYPEPVIAEMRDAPQAKMRLEDRYIDAIAEPLAATTRNALLLADAPRAMIDLNRSVDDVDWGMIPGAKERRAPNSLANRRARSGLGLVPRRIPGMGEIWRSPLAREDLENRIEGIYAPYHAALGAELERIRDLWGIVVLIDLHSMPPLRSVHPQSQPAEFVIGDRFGASCDPRLVDLALRYLSGQGRRVAHNRPYAGGYVLDRYGQTRRSIHAMQIETCRSIYLDARLDLPSARLCAVVRLLSGLVRMIGEEAAMIARHGSLSHAAE